MGNHGSKKEVMQDHLADLEEVRDHLVEKGLEEASCRIYNASSVRNLVITNHIVGLKGRILMRELVLLIIRL